MRYLLIGVGGSMFLLAFGEIFGTLPGIAALGLWIAALSLLFPR